MTEENTQSPVPAPAAAAAEPAAPTAPINPLKEQIDIDQFMKADLRVAQIIAAEPIEKSKKLLRLTVNVGERLGNRQVLAGIAQFYQPNDLVGRRIVIVANLKPAKLMGHESQGMLLAGAADDGSALRIVEPSADLPLGAVVR